MKIFYFVYFYVTLTLINCYLIDDKDGVGRTFEGIGAISGGGATTKLLVGYPERQKKEILDYLFIPNFGASLQILKVEIGGDAQSTDGTESSHMHEEWDENYTRGYEWWLMVEAKKRNPAIKLYGLAWAYPAWVGRGSNNPYKYPEMTASYLIKWVLAAYTHYNLTIDYLGIWNERDYDKTFVKTLKKQLNENGLQNIKLVVADSDWSPANDVMTDYAFSNAVDIIGAHYPGTTASANAVVSGKPLWASEDYSTYNNNVGAGCWARILNQNYVKGLMTSTIAWNLIASYYEALPFGREGLMTAQEPWSGHYVVESPIWITAHTTQFSSIGWRYLKHGRGVGQFDLGGSYVTLVSPDFKDFSIIIETMVHDESICIRPELPPYNVSAQQVEFQLDGSLLKTEVLYVWKSQLGPQSTSDQLFINTNTLQLSDGYFTIALDINQVYTITTLKRGLKGEFSRPPTSAPFPNYYFEDYEGYPVSSEAYNLAPQNGVFEIFETADPLHKKVNRQVIQNDPIKWCLQGMTTTLNIAGNYNWKNVKVATDFNIPSVNGSDGVFVAVRIDQAGCGADKASGIFFFLFPINQTYIITSDIGRKNVAKKGVFPAKLEPGTWHSMSLSSNDINGLAQVEIDDTPLTSITIPPSYHSGFIGYGTTSLGLTDFDNTLIQSTNPSRYYKPNWQTL